MKFVSIILRIKSFLTALALSLIFVYLFSDAAICPAPHISETVKTNALRPSGKSTDYVSSEDYAVYSAVMEQRLSARETYVIGDEAFDETPENALKNDRGFPRLNKETLDDYVRRNKEPRSLQNRFDLKSRLPVVLLSREEEAVFARPDAGWDEFFRVYPNSGGMIHFSNVGFNREKTEALVRIKYLCALCSGKETFYSLTKSDDNWRDRWRVR